MSSEDTNLRRIGELLYEGIQCSAASKSEEAPKIKASKEPGSRTENPSDGVASTIENHIGYVLEASPGQIALHFEISRSTVHRRLRVLLEEGRIYGTGKGRARVYRLVNSSN